MTPASVDHDVPCFACAYNLRGLPIVAAGRCPECGAAIGPSLDPNQLPTPLLRALRRGTRFVLLDCIALMASLPVMFFADRGGTRLFSNFVIPFETLVLAADQCLWIFAIFLLTTPISRLTDGGYLGTRWLARTLAILNVLAAAVMAVSFYGYLWYAPASPRFWTMLPYQGLLVYLALRAATIPLLTTRAGRLARLIQQPRLAAQIRRCGYAAAFVMLGLLLSSPIPSLHGFTLYSVLTFDLFAIFYLLALPVLLWAVCLAESFQSHVSALLQRSASPP